MYKRQGCVWGDWDYVELTGFAYSFVVFAFQWYSRGGGDSDDVDTLTGVYADQTSDWPVHGTSIPDHSPPPVVPGDDDDDGGSPPTGMEPQGPPTVVPTPTDTGGGGTPTNSITLPSGSKVIVISPSVTAAPTKEILAELGSRLDSPFRGSDA